MFLKVRFRMQPFNWRILSVVGIFLFSYLVSSIIPEQIIVVDILLRSTLFAFAFGVMILIFKISSEVNLLFDQVKNIIK